MKRTIMAAALTTLMASALLPTTALAHGPKPGSVGHAPVVTSTTTTTTTTTKHSPHPGYLAPHHAHGHPGHRPSRHSQHHHPRQPQHPVGHSRHHRHGSPSQVVVIQQPAPKQGNTLRIQIGYDLRL